MWCSKRSCSTFPGLVAGHSSHSSSSSPHNPSSSSTSTSPTGAHGLSPPTGAAAAAPPPPPHGHYGPYGAAAHHRPHAHLPPPGQPAPPPGAAAAAVLSQFYDQHARPQHFPRSGESTFNCDLLPYVCLRKCLERLRVPESGPARNHSKPFLREGT